MELVEQIPQVNDAKYLGMCLDGQFDRKKHISSKQRKQLGLELSKMYWQEFTIRKQGAIIQNL